jgi:hypothetical protein
MDGEKLPALSQQNLEALSRVAYASLCQRAGELDPGLVVEDFSGFSLASGKGYSARADARLCFGKGLTFGHGRITLAAFRPGQGTGGGMNYPTLRKAGVPECFIPRSTDLRHLAIAYFSIGTLVGEDWHDGITSLQGVTINPPDGIMSYCWFTEPNRTTQQSRKRSGVYHYEFALNRHLPWPDNGGNHAVIWKSKHSAPVGNGDNRRLVVQVGGFLPFIYDDSSLDILKMAALVKYRRTPARKTSEFASI